MPTRVRELSPLKLERRHYEAIEKAIRDHIIREIIEPLAEVVKLPIDEIRKNAKGDSLIDAITRGEIQYVDDHFEGRFSARTSKALKGMGARWDRLHGWWSIPRHKLTMDLNAAIGTSQSRFKLVVDRFRARLESLVPKDIAARLSLDKVIDPALRRMELDWRESSKALSLKVDMTPEQKKFIREKYTNNVKLKIQGWSEGEVRRLRERVQKSVNQGFRAETLVKAIKERKKVSESKARFLARNETSIMMANFREARYRAAGVQRYRWQCAKGSSAHPVREFHQALDGSLQSWSSPPIIDRNGNRKHPGQDYNCRCIAIPVLETQV